MWGSGGAPASAGEGGDGDTGGKMGEVDGGGSKCLQRGSTDRKKWSQGGVRNRAPSLCLDSGREGNPAAHRDSRRWGGSDSAGSRGAGAAVRGRRTTRRGGRTRGLWPASGNLGRQEMKVWWRMEEGSSRSRSVCPCCHFALFGLFSGQRLIFAALWMLLP